MKYIDAEKLIAEIERLLAKAKNDEEKAFAKKDAAGHLAAVTKTAVCAKIKKLISTLQQEQPDVDLEKEIQEHIKECLDVKFPTTDIELIKKDVAYTAKKFYELGLNARKEK